VKVLVIATFALCLLASPAAFAQEAAELVDLDSIEDSSGWTLFNVDAESATVGGRSAAYLRAHGDSANGLIGLALPKIRLFRSGSIELDLKGKSLRGNSFLGVAFNVTDAKFFEAIYFRPFNFNVNPPFQSRGVQYISWPANTWEHLRKTQPGKFENRVSNVPDADEWFHARIEVSAGQVRVFVNCASEPALVIERLATNDDAMPFGLFVDTADGYYANVRVTHAP
jgi:hypothetical protein